MPTSITAQADAELDRLVAAVPSTGKGAAHLTVASDGFRADLAQRWNPHVASSAYWQKSFSGKPEYGARTTFSW